MEKLPKARETHGRLKVWIYDGRMVKSDNKIKVAETSPVIILVTKNFVVSTKFI